MASAPSIDLHVHSHYSDGRLSPEELVSKAVHNNVVALAITDHDTMAGVEAKSAACRAAGIECVAGVEISCEYEGNEAHIISLFADPHSPEIRRLDELGQSREKRMEQMLVRLARLGIELAMSDLPIAADGIYGRPHLARALVAKGVVKSVNEAFARLLYDDGPVHISKTRLPAAEGIALAKRLGGVSVLAHPGISGLIPHLDAFVAMGLEGVEAYHPKHGGETLAALLRYCRDRKLLVSGGSDFHSPGDGPDIGSSKVPVDVLEPLRTAATTRKAVEMVFFDTIRSGLKKTRDILFMDVKDVFRIGRRVDETLLAELEERLVLADVGPRLSAEVVDEIRRKYKNKEIDKAGDILDFLKKTLSDGLQGEGAEKLRKNPDGPTLVLMVGVNGTGKTTTTAKLAKYLKDGGAKVILAAADTFRAAAGEQLDIWAGRVGVDIVRHADGADPAAVVFDACEAALARKTDYVLVDTAGRIHTKANLMQQLEKIHRVAGKKIPGAPHEVLLVLDATTGQNALSQAKLFTEGVGVTGLVLTKLDGTAKGGVVIAINRQIKLPIKFIGVGEKENDFAPFDAKEFTDALFAGVRTEEEG